MKVLLSIKPEFAGLIFSGVKRFEYRKSLFRAPGITTVLVYATRPIAKLIGEFDLAGVDSGPPAEVWRRTREFSGISHEFFKAYFEGRRIAFALAVGNAKEYGEWLDPRDINPHFAAPQSYLYVDDYLKGIPTPDGTADLFA